MLNCSYRSFQLLLISAKHLIKFPMLAHTYQKLSSGTMAHTIMASGDLTMLAMYILGNMNSCMLLLHVLSGVSQLRNSTSPFIVSVVFHN